MRKAIKTCMALFSLGVALFWPGITVQASTVLYEYIERQTITKDVYYELNRQMTELGMRDVHVLSIPLTDPNIRIGPAESQKALGLKETASTILASAGAVAGINADFFDLAGSYSWSFGPVAANGKLLSVSQEVNKTTSAFATFLLDDEDNPFLRYVNADIAFLSNGREHIYVWALNKVTDMSKAVVITTDYMQDTAELDARFPGQLVKVVVSNNRITYISAAGETVNISQNGYAVVLGKDSTHQLANVAVGHTAELRITNNLNIDFANIQAAISGGGLILQNGKIVYDQGTVVAGRHPRSALGISRDKERLILMVVDGRTFSVGATHEEMAALLTRYGAYEAMHLDGGGSSTMVARFHGDEKYTVVNTVSDGSQRRIINALGVFNDAQEGPVQALELILSDTNALVGVPLTAKVYGLDAYYRRIELPADEVIITIGTADDTDGVVWDGDRFLIDNVDYVYVKAQYKDLTVTETICASEIAELRNVTAAVRTIPSLSVPLSFSAIGQNGVVAAVPWASEEEPDGLHVKVVPSRLGYVSDGVFHGVQKGGGYLQCELNGFYAYIPLSVGASEKTLPIADTQLKYAFVPDEGTQNAYLTFAQPHVLNGAAPYALRVSVLGDGSGLQLRGTVVDSKGNAYEIDFAQALDFEGRQDCYAILPRYITTPVTFTRLYLVSRDTVEPLNGTIEFRDFASLLLQAYSADVPEGSTFVDPLWSSTVDTTEMWSTLPLAKDQVLSYKAFSQDAFAVLEMTATKGGLFATNASQWAAFNKDIDRLDPDYLIVQLDTPLNAFTNSQETALLHKALLTQQAEGRTVFVVTPGGSDTLTCDIVDGIRYLQTGVLKDNTYLLFRTGAWGIAYGLASCSTAGIWY